MVRWLNKDGRDNTQAPFQTLYRTAVPSNSEGSNGDFCFVYANSSYGVYKKVDGAWVHLTRGADYFAGFDSSNSQLFLLTSSFSEVTVTAFTFTDSSGLRVEVDGIAQYEGASYAFQRNSSLGKIVFTETTAANGDSPVAVFVGKHEGPGFSGFTTENSQLFVLTANTDSVTVTNFTLLDSSKLQVEVDGMAQYEGATQGWERDIVNNQIDFVETIQASASAPVIVFVGKYS